jgi:hypothetical protein
MLAEYKNQTNLGVGIGFVVTLVSRFLAQQQPSLQIVGIGLGLIGVGLIVWGCMGYAKGKGYSQYWGLLGVLWILGFIILALFPDRAKGPQP